MQQQDVILVNSQDEPIGAMEKMEAHQKGLLHRAFSVFIFDKEGRMLLQQRAAQKYHGAYLWTNACCSHPFPGEEVEDAALRRLREELGLTTPLEKLFAFTYKAAVENDLIEHEYDHVFVGEYEGPININRDEVHKCEYRSMESIEAAIERQPNAFTEWFKIIFPQMKTWWEKTYATVLKVE